MPSILLVLTSRKVKGIPVAVAPKRSVSALTAPANMLAVKQKAAAAERRKEVLCITSVLLGVRVRNKCRAGADRRCDLGSRQKTRGMNGDRPARVGRFDVRGKSRRAL